MVGEVEEEIRQCFIAALLFNAAVKGARRPILFGYERLLVTTLGERPTRVPL